jgi:hypothetical protein
MKMKAGRGIATLAACPHCGATAHRPGARFCSHCGAPLPEPPDWRSPESQSHLFWGMILTLFGVMLYLWASHHSLYRPQLIAGLVLDPNGYYIQEPAYSLIVLVAAASGLYGVVQILRRLIGGVR